MLMLLIFVPVSILSPRGEIGKPVDPLKNKIQCLKKSYTA